MTETTTGQGAPRSVLAFLRDGRAGEQRAARGRQPWTAKRVIATLLMIVLPLIAVAGVFGGSAAFADTDKGQQYSFYKVASSTTAFFSTAQEPDSKDAGFSEQWLATLADPGSAGSLLGYADANLSDVSGWLASKLSGSSDAIGYDTLRISSDDDSGKYSGSNYQGMVDYAYYGAALKGMGLDSTSTGMQLGFVKVIGGGIMMLLFVLGGAVDFVFNAVIGVLAMLNPFKLFYAGVSAINPALADGMVGNGSTDVGPLSGLVSWIGGWYQALTSLSWSVMVPLFITVLLFSLLMFKKMNRGGALKKILIRVFFIGIGLPLLGTMYTGMLNGMQDASSTGSSGSARVVQSTYVDFENWAINSRLAVPSSGATIQWDTKTATPSGAAQANVRNTALAINNASHDGNDLTAIVTSGDYDASWANQVMQGRASEASSASDTFGTTVDMLVRYMGGNQVSSASFETVSKGNLTQSAFYTADAGANQKTVKGWFDDLTDPKALKDQDPSGNPVIAVTARSGLQASGDRVRSFSSNVSNCAASGTKVSTDKGETRSCNLSPLAMYNYLNTDFDSTSMRMYSSSMVASEATRSVHNSVTQVGTGAMSGLYWLNSAVLLGSFILIGIGYAFSLMFSSIRRSFQIVTAVPFATLGALAAIAKVVVYSIALILEVLVTIFVYKLVQEMLTSLPQIIEMPFAVALNNGKAAAAGFVAFLTAGWGFSLVVTLLSIIGVVCFTVLAMRIRKAFVKTIEEAVTKLVEKFMDTGVGMPGGGKLGPALAGGLASGAGAAAANRMMTGGNGKRPAINAPANTSGNGPEGIATAGGVVPTGPGPSTGPDGHLAIEGKTAGADGNGDQGGPMGALPAGGEGGKAAADEVALGRSVEVNGLSKPGEIEAPKVGGDDVLSGASNSLDKTAEGYKDADKKKLEIGKEGAQALGHGAIALGRGVSGDAKGAIESGGRAVQHSGAAVAADQEGKQKAADAGRSSLDKPTQQHSQNAKKARQVSNVGGAVAGAAGATGGKKASAGGATPGKARSVSPQRPHAQGQKPASAASRATPAPQRPAGSGRTNGAAGAPAPQVQQQPRPVQAGSTGSAPRAPQPPKQQAPAAPKPPRPVRPVGQAPRPTPKGSPSAPAPRSSSKPVRRQD